jgi:hypothetical protein
MLRFYRESAGELPRSFPQVHPRAFRGTAAKLHSIRRQQAGNIRRNRVHDACEAVVDGDAPSLRVEHA